jgi:hypothetical protein
MDTPGECVTQEKFNGRGENRLAKVEVAQPMGRTPAKRSQTFDTVLEKALISPLQKAPPELERRASALEKELASLIL